MYRRPLTKNGKDDTRYPINWNAIRFFVFKRDKYICQLCGRKNLSKPDCHHLIPLGCGGSNHIDNLVTVCRSCHSRVHGK